MIWTNEIQTAIVADLLSYALLTVKLTDPEEVREFNWKGQNFTYPNIRVEITKNVPNLGSDMCLSEVELNIYCFSETASSRQANEIAGIIADKYHKKSLNSQGIFFTHIRVEHLPAIAQSEIIWRSQVMLSSTVRRA